MVAKLSTATMHYFVALVVAAALLRVSVAQETYVVGDSLGWLVPPGGALAYSTWAAMHTFSVGNVLVFNFETGRQDIARVTKEAFDSCNSSSPILLKTTGPANFTLSAAGEYYFICTMESHCPLGQKLAINVTSPSSAPSPDPVPPPPPPPPASTASPVPSRAPITYVVGDGLGWLVPPGGVVAYATWASGKTFVVGDKLVFNFVTGQQNVAKIRTKKEFDSCNSTNPIAVETNGPATFTLDTAGDHYFIGTMERHCPLGQKLAINVIAGTGAPVAPSPNAPAPPRGPVNYVVGDDLGWLVPPGGATAYATWAFDKSFIVGDILVFNFVNGTQDVAVVDKSAYETCDTNKTMSVLSSSPAKITLTAAGDHFFTCTFPRHCALGQQLSIHADAGVQPVPSGSPIGSPTASRSSAGGAPPPESSAPPQILGSFFINFLFIIIVWFIN